MEGTLIIKMLKLWNINTTKHNDFFINIMTFDATKSNIALSFLPTTIKSFPSDTLSVTFKTFRGWISQ